MTNPPFNPLDKANLGKSVAEALLAQPVQPLIGLKKFEGSGIYAIYYAGNFPCYAALIQAHESHPFSTPIYVGKAIPKGGRKGGHVEDTKSMSLFARLMQHGKSVIEAENLDEKDFFCRFLVVDDIWIPLGETLLITKFAPVWNKLVDGFGNHNPGKRRHAGLRPRWDVLHPGRPWAERCQPRSETADEIARDVSIHLRNSPVLAEATSPV